MRFVSTPCCFFVITRIRVGIDLAQFLVLSQATTRQCSLIQAQCCQHLFHCQRARTIASMWCKHACFFFYLLSQSLELRHADMLPTQISWIR